MTGARVAQSQIRSRAAVRDYGVAIFVAVMIALLIRFFIFEAYRIPSAAMRPTLEPGDFIFVAKWPYGLKLPGTPSRLTSGRPPARGEVIIFSLPEGAGRDYIKRVVAIAGDTVTVRKGQLWVNDRPLSAVPKKSEELCGTETVFADPSSTPQKYRVCWEPPLIEDFGPEKIPEDSAFVLGDLRTLPAGSSNLKSWGVIQYSWIKAKALWVWLSIDPPALGGQESWLARIRYERMFRSIDTQGDVEPEGEK